MSQAPALADALLAPPAGSLENAPLTRLRRRAAWSVGVVAVVLLAWSALAPIRGAVIAVGLVRADLDSKTVRHQEGGIVREILVREGQKVSPGQALLVIGDVRTDALLDLQQDQWVSESIRHARLSAEFALATAVEMPAGIEPGDASSDYLRRERVLFDARRKTLLEQQASLLAQIDATREQVRALQAQAAATQQGAALAREELRLNRDLERDGFIQRTRLLALERAASDYDSRAGEHASDLAQARQRLADLQLRAAQTRNQYQQQAATELKESTARLREIEEQLRPARDAADRQVVRSPVAGEVMSLLVNAVGEVVGPREALLVVVPANEPLVIEARVAVEDIEHVRTGADAEVRLSAYEYRAMPMLPARVTAVSADRVADERSGLAWFNARIEVDPQALGALKNAEMKTGMPAEVYVQTDARSLLEYVLQPLSAFARRGMREP